AHEAHREQQLVLCYASHQPDFRCAHNGVSAFSPDIDAARTYFVTGSFKDAPEDNVARNARVPGARQANMNASSLHDDSFPNAYVGHGDRESSTPRPSQSTEPRLPAHAAIVPLSE